MDKSVLIQGAALRFRDVEKSYFIAKGVKTSTLNDISQLQKDVGLAKARMLLASHVEGVLELLRSSVHEKTVGSLESLLTQSMHDVFPEKGNDKVVIDLVTKSGKSSMSFNVAREGGGIQSIYNGNGGALTNVIGFALRMISVYKGRHSLRQIVALDETDCWIEPSRIPLFFNVIKDVSENLGIQVVMVTHHDSKLFERAHCVHLNLNSRNEITIDYDGIQWTPGQKGIRSVRLENVRTHKDSFIELSPFVTLITGENNIGKSVVIEALRNVAYGEAQDEFIRHGCNEATVTIDMGHQLLRWRRNIKGNPKESYQLLNQMGDIIREESRSRGDVPSWVQSIECLGMRTIDDLPVQVEHQKKPVFLLDEKGSTQASILSVGQESEWVERLFAAHKSLKKKDRDIIEQGESRLTLLNARMDSLENFFDYVNLARLREQMEHLTKENIALADIESRLTFLKENTQKTKLHTRFVKFNDVYNFADTAQLENSIQFLRATIKKKTIKVHLWFDLPAWIEVDYQDYIRLRNAKLRSSIHFNELLGDFQNIKPQLNDLLNMETMVLIIKKSRPIHYANFFKEHQNKNLSINAHINIIDYDVKHIDRLKSLFKKISLPRLSMKDALLPIQPLYIYDAVKHRENLMQIKQSHIDKENEYNDISRDIKMNEEFKNKAINEFGGRCPLCLNPLNSKHYNPSKQCSHNE